MNCPHCNKQMLTTRAARRDYATRLAEWRSASTLAYNAQQACYNADPYYHLPVSATVADNAMAALAAATERLKEAKEAYIQACRNGRSE